MRWLVALALAAAVAVVAIVTFATDDGPPRLRVVSASPLSVEGRRFVPDEIVEVVVRDGARTYRREVTATDEGSFRTALSKAAVDPCGGATVTATGDEGSRVAAKLPQRLCPP
jgi:hypothetical protein